MPQVSPSAMPSRPLRSFVRGGIVDWQPGDGTRYECALFIKGHEWLGIANFNSLISDPPRDMKPLSNLAAIDFFASMIPRGSWSGLRPLFAALDWIAGPTTFDRRDAEWEWNARKGRGQMSEVGFDPQGKERAKDQELGRMVRSAVMPILLKEQREQAERTDG